MSYQVLARKWRPRNFQEMVGQQHVLTALANGLAQNRVHHAYLFSGTRGVGKTTIARILAKSLNCEQGVTASPCGECVHCQAIDQGRFVDLLEIDAASRTRVDDTRELLDNVQYKPALGRYKVYLIDEVHMLSKHSFNALLKTLEEPPEYVKFLLATTDPQKLPITVLSRCLQFHLKALLPEEIEKQLNFILQQEHASFDHAAIAVIAKAADGSMRDALSLTDQALAFGAGNIEYQSVLKMLGTLDSSHLYYLLHFIASGNVEKVFQKMEEFVHLGADFAKLHQELAALCHQIALLQMHNKSHAAEKSALQLLAERLSPEEVQLYYQIAVQGYKDYAFAPNGRIALEMTVMRLLAFKPANYIALDENLLNQAQISGQSPVPSPAVLPTVPVTVKPAASVTDDASQAPSAAPAQATEQVPPNDVAMYSNASVNNAVLGEDSDRLAVTDPQPATANAAMPEPTAQQASIEQVTHSRNMLRSHRLKREEAKKSQATTVNQTTDHLVAEKTASAHSHNIQGKAETGIPIPEVQNSAPATAPPPISDSGLLSAMPDQRLPPIAQYSERDSSHSDEFIEPDSEVAPENRVFFSDEKFDLPAIDIAAYVEGKLTDPWSLLIQQMQLVGLVKLLAKNSVMQQVEQQIVLTLKSEQQHLLNNHSLCEQLQAKLKAHYGAQIGMYIEVGNVDGQLTPVESELLLFQQSLDNAKCAIKEDKNIQMLQRDYGAKIYENSIIPL